MAVLNQGNHDGQGFCGINGVELFKNIVGGTYRQLVQLPMTELNGYGGNCWACVGVYGSWGGRVVVQESTGASGSQRQALHAHSVCVTH